MPRPTKELQREYQRKWMSDRRAAWFADKACLQCGSVSELHIHHRLPEHKVHHAIWSWSKDRREVELEKCDVLCRACHQELHAKERRRHGTVSRYSNGGCRCDLCKRAKAKKTAQERARRKERERRIDVAA